VHKTQELEGCRFLSLPPRVLGRISPALLIPKPVVFTLLGGKSIVVKVPFVKTYP
jgi:hypothetical protein